MREVSEREVDRVMQALPPEARVALKFMSEAQKRPVEDVLRDEIEAYIAGKLPAIDIDFAMEQIKQTAHKAGFLIGRLRRFAREYTSDD